METQEVEIQSAAPAQRNLAFFAVCLGNFIILLDTNIVNLAITDIHHTMGGTLPTLEWIVNGYTLAVAAFILAGGSIADRLGNDRAYRRGLLGFAAASAACALAPDVGVLIAARVAQGACGALLLPSLLGLIPHLYREPVRQARAVTIWAGTGGVALAVGPPLAGALIDTLGWRSIFFINLPVCLLAYAIVRWTLSDVPRGNATRIDLAGQTLAIIVMVGLCYVAVEGATIGWTSPLAIAVIVVSLAAAAAFCFVETRFSHPLLPPRLFAGKGFSAAIGNVFIFQFVYFGVLFLFPWYLQNAQRDSALHAGLELLPITVTTAFAPPFITRLLITRYGLRRPVLLGSCLGVAGFAIIIPYTSASPYWLLAAGMALQGIWSGMVFPPTASLAVTSTPPELSGTGSGLLNTSRQLGGAVGVAVLVMIVDAARTLDSGLHIAMIVLTVGSALIALVALAAYRPGVPSR